MNKHAGIWDATKAFIQKSPRLATGAAGGIVGGAGGGVLASDENKGKGMAIGAIAGATAGAVGGKKLVTSLFNKAKPVETAAASTGAGEKAVENVVAVGSNKLTETTVAENLAKARPKSDLSFLPKVDGVTSKGGTTLTTKQMGQGRKDESLVVPKEKVTQPTISLATPGEATKANPTAWEKVKGGAKAFKEKVAGVFMKKPIMTSLESVTPPITTAAKQTKGMQTNTFLDKVDAGVEASNTPQKPMTINFQKNKGRGRSARRETIIPKETPMKFTGKESHEDILSAAGFKPDQIVKMNTKERALKSQDFLKLHSKEATISLIIKNGSFGKGLMSAMYHNPRVATGVAGGVLGATAGGVVSEDTGKGMLMGGVIGATAGALGGKALKSSVLDEASPLFGKSVRKNLIQAKWDTLRANARTSKDVLYKAPDREKSVEGLTITAAYDIRQTIGGRLSTGLPNSDNKGIRRARSMDKLIGVKNKIDVALENEMKFVQENMATLSNEQKVKAHFNIKHLKEVQSRLGKSLSQVRTGAGGNVSEAVHSPLKDNIVRTILDLPKKYQSKNVERTTRIKNIGGESKKVVNSIVAAPSSKMKLLLPLGLAAGVAGVVGYKYYKNNVD